MFTGFVMLLLHSQVSVAFSYPQVQCLAALSLAWLAATKPLQNKGRAWFRPLFKITWLLWFAVIAVSWWHFAWQPLWFHRAYKKAIKTSWKQPEQRLANFLSISPPIYKNYYTLHWHQTLGGELLNYMDYNRSLVMESISTFQELENYMPLYGHFLVRQAVFYARTGETAKAQQYFYRFAAKNPFSLELWSQWAIACKHCGLSFPNMHKTVRQYQQKFGKDGALLVGEALALYGMNNPEQAIHLIKQAKIWAKNRQQNFPDNRAREILIIKEPK